MNNILACIKNIISGLIEGPTRASDRIFDPKYTDFAHFGDLQRPGVLWGWSPRAACVTHRLTADSAVQQGYQNCSKIPKLQQAHQKLQQARQKLQKENICWNRVPHRLPARPPIVSTKMSLNRFAPAALRLIKKEQTAAKRRSAETRHLKKIS